MPSLRPLLLDVPRPWMEMEVRLPELRLQQRWPEVRIDVRPALEDLGLRRNHTIARTHAALGREALLRDVARTAREGDELRDIHRGFRLLEIAVERSKPRERQLNVDVAPKARVAVEAELGSVEVDLQPGAVHIRVPWERVKVYLAQAEQGPSPAGLRSHRVGSRLDLLA